MHVLDYSAGFPPVLTGYLGVVRYIGTPGRPKNLTPFELSSQGPAPVPRAYVYEGAAGWMLGGRQAGFDAAGAAQRDAFNLRATVRRLYAACDIDTDPSDYPAIEACLRGMALVLGTYTVSLYGEADVIDAMWNAYAIIRPAWQTVAWSGRRVSDYACLLQTGAQVTVGGVSCDINDVLDPNGDWGQWPPPPRPPAPAGPSQPLAVQLAGRDET